MNMSAWNEDLSLALPRRSSQDYKNVMCGSGPKFCFPNSNNPIVQAISSNLFLNNNNQPKSLRDSGDGEVIRGFRRLGTNGQNGVANISLNTPFLKISPNKPSVLLVEDSDVDSSSDVEGHGTDEDSPVVVSANRSQAHSSHINNTCSRFPKRKRKRPELYFSKPKESTRRRTERDKHRRFDRRRKSSKWRPSRASLRLYRQKKLSPSKSGKRRNMPTRIQRTVEMVDQRGDQWRDIKSKLLFMLSLGLNPKPDAKRLPFVLLDRADPTLVEEIRQKTEERLEKLKIANELRMKEHLRQLRLQHAANIRRLSIRQNSLRPFQSNVPIEVIDIASDEENDGSTEYILPDFSIPMHREKKPSSNTKVTSSVKKMLTKTVSITKVPCSPTSQKGTKNIRPKDQGRKLSRPNNKPIPPLNRLEAGGDHQTLDIPSLNRLVGTGEDHRSQQIPPLNRLEAGGDHRTLDIPSPNRLVGTGEDHQNQQIPTLNRLVRAGEDYQKSQMPLPNRLVGARGDHRMPQMTRHQQNAYSISTAKRVHVIGSNSKPVPRMKHVPVNPQPTNLQRPVTSPSLLDEHHSKIRSIQEGYRIATRRLPPPVRVGEDDVILID